MDQKKSISIATIGIILILLIILLVIWLVMNPNKKSKPDISQVSPVIASTEYRMTGNSLDNFDLYFLSLNNNKSNIVYSPLSIKYTLEMLSEGATGETKKQIDNIIGEYKSTKYLNSNHISFANSLFVKDTYKESIKKDYINNLLSKYNADVIYDSFSTPDTINSWISDKTFNLIQNPVNDVSNQNFVLVNALAIDMDWKNNIQSKDVGYYEYYSHEKFFKDVPSLDITSYHALNFDNVSYTVNSAEIGAAINKYDILSEVGEDKIRQTVGNEYQKWLDEGALTACGSIEEELDKDSFLNKYISEIKDNYKKFSSSTDFEFYVDDKVKVFAKDLKEYNGITLQYVGIMPKEMNLQEYIENINAKDINVLINNLKEIKLENFKDKTITEIYGYIPMFNFNYDLKLMDNLKKLDITDVFASNKADLSNISSEPVFINQALHKSNIEFSNEGIKAASATIMGGAGAGECGFDYLYEVPLERIDLTFDKPFMFIIRNKDTGEVWFTGAVYEPLKWEEPLGYCDVYEC